MPNDDTDREESSASPASPQFSIQAGDESTEVPAGPRFFFRTDMPARRYIVRMAVVSFVPTALLSLVLATTGILTEGNAPEFEGPPAVVLFLGIFTVSPLLETLFMAAILRLLTFATKQPVQLAFASCVVWAVLHSLMTPIWGLMVAWPFFVFSSAYLAWRRISWSKAVLVATGIHALHNLLPAIAAAAAAA